MPNARTHTILLKDTRTAMTISLERNFYKSVNKSIRERINCNVFQPPHCVMAACINKRKTKQMAALRADHFSLIYVFIPSKSHNIIIWGRVEFFFLSVHLFPFRLQLSVHIIITLSFANIRNANRECQCTRMLRSVRRGLAMALHWHIVVSLCVFVCWCFFDAIVVGCWMHSSSRFRAITHYPFIYCVFVIVFKSMQRLPLSTFVSILIQLNTSD